MLTETRFLQSSFVVPSGWQISQMDDLAGGGQAGSAEDDYAAHLLRTDLALSKLTSTAAAGGSSADDLLFPSKLFQMLEGAAMEGFEAIVSWGAEPNAFNVHKKRRFEEKVLPKYFKMTKYKSFTRQLYNYGFTWIRKGPDKGGYCHDHFSRYDSEKSRVLPRRTHRESISASSGAVKDDGSSRPVRGSSSTNLVDLKRSKQDPERPRRTDTGGGRELVHSSLQSRATLRGEEAMHQQADHRDPRHYANMPLPAWLHGMSHFLPPGTAASSTLPSSSSFSNITAGLGSLSGDNSAAGLSYEPTRPQGRYNDLGRSTTNETKYNSLTSVDELYVNQKMSPPFPQHQRNERRMGDRNHIGTSESAGLSLLEPRTIEEMLHDQQDVSANSDRSKLDGGHTRGAKDDKFL